MSVRLDVPPVGVRIIRDQGEIPEAETYSGVSYCDAVRSATFGRELLVTCDSIEVCKWSPVVLGFKEPGNAFERGIEPRLSGTTLALHVARLDLFKGAGPDVVVFRGKPEILMGISELLGEGTLIKKYVGDTGRTALGGQSGEFSRRMRLIHASNRILASLRKVELFDRFTKFAFRSQLVTSTFERIIKNTLADMSICRNSTVIPILERAGNISFFCPGGITWGGNDPSHMTSGFPYFLVEPALDEIEFPT